MSCLREGRFSLEKTMRLILNFSVLMSFMFFSGYDSFAAQNFNVTSAGQAKGSGILSSATQAETQLYKELTGKDYGAMGEMGLYSEILTAYQSQRETEFSTLLSVFLQKYSQSVYADNALFLAGKMALEKKQYGKAVGYFQKVEDQFPQSNKKVSAAFAKGIAYKKMNLEKLALRVFEDVKKKYPGSPESFRASNEVKLIRAN
jgi:TolA-binding protein